MGRISMSSPSSHGLDDTLRMWLTNPREGGRGREGERGREREGGRGREGGGF